MKLPFSFAARLFFRLLLPGALFALFLYPAARQVADWLGLNAGFEVLFPALVASLGWLICLLDPPIYMLFEGRALWPAGLYIAGIRWQARRLKRLRSLAVFHNTEKHAYIDNAARCSKLDAKNAAMMAAAKYHSHKQLEIS